MRQWARMDHEQQAWVAALIKGESLDTGFTADEAAPCWEVETAIASRRIWSLECCGLVVREMSTAPDLRRWRVEPIAHKVLTENVQSHEKKRKDGPGIPNVTPLKKGAV